MKPSKQYTFHANDVWGNAKDGFTVNDTYPSRGVWTIPDDATDYQVNRILRIRGVKWEWHEHGAYGELKNGNPICQLRLVEE